jgi:hypothetical protein
MAWFQGNSVFLHINNFTRELHKAKRPSLFLKLDIATRTFHTESQVKTIGVDGDDVVWNLMALLDFYLLTDPQQVLWADQGGSGTTQSKMWQSCKKKNENEEEKEKEECGIPEVL